MQNPGPPIGAAPALAWTEAGAPRSAVFDDIYFQPGEGLAETRAVFLEGCGLPDAWRGRRRFVVGELGFGTGLNILALLDLWRRTRADGQRLHVFTVEAFPLAADDARRALAAFPELGDLADALVSQWPRQARGWHRLTIEALGFTLDLAVDTAQAALSAWRGRADAWFLDGFAPAANPEMWSDAVLGLVAARSAPGARVATFTVAGAVRRSLAAHGFAVERAPGYGRKRQRLEGRLPGSAVDSTAVGRVAVIGGGVAAAAILRALEAEGVEAVQVAPAGDAGASGNPSALVTPGLDAGEGVAGRFYAQALARAADLYRAVPDAVIGRGVLQMEREARDASRFDRVAASGLYAPGALRRLDAAGAGERLGEPAMGGALWIEDALTVSPAAVLATWRAPQRVDAEVEALRPGPRGWTLIGAGGQSVLEADQVCIAAGAGTRSLAPLRLQIVRGQASWASVDMSVQAAAWGGYVAPARTGVLFGATHDREDEDTTPRPEDHRRNLETLAKARPALAARLEAAPLDGRAGLRAAAKDRLPAAGLVAEGLHVLTALGSRGFTSAPLLGEAVAAGICGAPSPLPDDLAVALLPGRAALRDDA
jgi:tRNA 5-methylaminomethyl-2-thiouridine biosynthesis bifunctional protein